MKSKKKYIIFLVVIVLFSMVLVDRTMQNDTFFYIAIGERLAKTHVIDGLDHWSFHENLRFTYPGWIVNLIMYLLYNSFGFTGIYVLILIITGIIGITIFNTLLKEKNNIALSFIMTLAIVYSIRTMFAARNQIFSFLLFILETNFLIGLLEQGKKRYFWLLILLAFCLVAVHDTVYILMFVIALPYLAEIILQKLKIKLPRKFRIF